MSHIAVVNCVITNLDALATAAEKLGGELMRDQRSFRMYGSQQQPCLHAIRLKGKADAYEVGLRQKAAEEPGTFDLACDFFDGNLTKAFGQNLTGLQNEYTALVAEQAMRRRGYRVQRDAEAPANVIRLVARA